MACLFSNQVELPLKSMFLKPLCCRNEKLFDVGFGCPRGRSDSGQVSTGWNNSPTDKPLALFSDNAFYNPLAGFALVLLARQKNHTGAELSGSR